jgi:hypothetical protein
MSGAERESATPFVLGCLMVVFAAIGLWLQLHSISAGSDVIAAVPATHPWLRALQYAGVGVGLVHAVAGLRAIGYRSDARMWAAVYAVAAIAWALAVWHFTVPSTPREYGIIWRWLGIVPPDRDLRDAILVVKRIASLAWPALVFLVMSRPAIRRQLAR